VFFNPTADIGRPGAHGVDYQPNGFEFLLERSDEFTHLPWFNFSGFPPDIDGTP
jgi:hypothetical protein